MGDVVIIACAGKSSRWRRHLSLEHKALIPILGETLVARTVRLAREHCPEARLCVMGSHPALRVDGAELVAPAPCERPCEVDRFPSAKPYWSEDGRTHLLFGDVFFTDAAAALVFAPSVHPLHWYARPHASGITGKPYGEIFGVSFDAEGGRQLAKHAEIVRTAYHTQQAKAALGWEVLSSTLGLPLIPCGRPTPDHMTVIDDETDDFDCPNDHERWERLILRKRWGKPTRY